MISQKKIDDVYRKYKSITNMSYSELKRWSKTAISRDASLSREPLSRNLKLLSTPKSKWGKSEVIGANKTISYLSRAKKIKRAKGVPSSKLSRNEIAMKNWAFDINK